MLLFILSFSISFIFSETAPYEIFKTRIIAFGGNDYYQLSSYMPSPILSPGNNLINYFPVNRSLAKNEIIDICSGNQVTFYLTVSGEVFFVGSHVSLGECSSGLESYIPTKMNVYGKFVKKMNCMFNSAVFYTNDTIYGVGSNIWCSFMGCGESNEYKTSICNPTNILYGDLLENTEFVNKSTFHRNALQNSIILLRNLTTDELVLHATGYESQGLLVNGLYTPVTFKGWIRMNDSIIIERLDSGRKIKAIEYFGNSALFILFVDGSLYFAGAGQNSGCLSIFDGPTRYPYFSKMPSQTECTYFSQQSEIGNQTITDIKCNGNACFMFSGNKTYSFGLSANDYYFGRMLDGLGDEQCADLVDLSNIQENCSSLVGFHFMSSFVVLPFYDECVNEFRFFGFGDNDKYGFFGDPDVNIDIPREIFTDIVYKKDFILSRGFSGSSLILLTSVKCWGFLSNESGVCSTHGHCVDWNTCQCEEHYDYLDDCSATSCFFIQSNVLNYVCSGHGNCTDYDMCECDEAYNFVSDCSVWSCFDVRSDSSVCSNNGDCVYPDECECHFNQRGVSLNCTIPNCYGISANEENVCSNAGVCIGNDECECAEGIGGETCDSTETSPVNIFSIVGISGGSVVAVSEQRMESDTSIAHLKINKNLFVIKKEDIRLVKVLGSGGSNSIVYLAIWEGKNVAFKCFKTMSICSHQNSFDEFEKEVQILGSISHPNIIQYYGSCLSPPRIGFVMEYCELGDLTAYITRKQKNQELFQLSKKIQILKEICCAMAFLHSKKIIHRDLKLENVLLGNSLTAKLMDFGLSRFYERTQQQKTKGVGTSFYMSPEIVKAKDYDHKVDVFSFGILMWLLITERMKPYDETYGIELKVANNPNYRPKFNNKDNYPKYLQELSKSAWQHDPRERPSFKEIQETLNTKEGVRKKKKLKEEDKSNIVESIVDKEKIELKKRIRVLEEKLSENGISYA